MPRQAVNRLQTMSVASQLLENAGAHRQTLPFACDAALSGAAFIFGLWTIATHIAVIVHLSFRTLSWIGPFLVIAGIACGLAASFDHTPEAKRLGEILAARPRWIWLAVPAALVLLRTLGMGYSAFWIGSFLFLVGAALKWRQGAELSAENEPHVSARQILAVAILAIGCAVVTYVCHRPDVDDAVYAGTAADAFAHPELPVLSHDVLYGGSELPPMLPSYKTESFELFIAFLAGSLRLPPIFCRACHPSHAARFVVAIRLGAPHANLGAAPLACGNRDRNCAARSAGRSARIRQSCAGAAVFGKSSSPEPRCPLALRVRIEVPTDWADVGLAAVGCVHGRVRGTVRVRNFCCSPGACSNSSWRASRRV